jgi:hypothetical protein
VRERIADAGRVLRVSHVGALLRENAACGLCMCFVLLRMCYLLCIGGTCVAQRRYFYLFSSPAGTAVFASDGSSILTGGEDRLVKVCQHKYLKILKFFL